MTDYNCSAKADKLPQSLRRQLPLEGAKGRCSAKADCHICLPLEGGGFCEAKDGGRDTSKNLIHL